ncbi:hypothetical protein FIBSPDRAFT_1044185 [Athelia psychrophila]|uniref:DUF6533 domain-containing protein n=1 Tax=Athelia psychrophila TaxID=1759441 RepID=A0A166K2P4_9AGAM|nr:hypothetical protein FIBSPDRAFT_1044185 [Fibularhizoctonia sp. CBS 109695]
MVTLSMQDPRPLGKEMVIARYSSVAILVAFMWSWALCMSEEVEVVRRKRLSVPIAVYYFSRFSSLGCCVCSVLADLGITHSPEVQYPTSFIFFWIAQSSTSLLFLLRIRAVYSHSIPVQYGFFALWIIITISPTLILLGPGIHCYRPEIDCYISGPTTLLPNGALLANDTLVFVAVSMAMYRNAPRAAGRLTYIHHFKLIIHGNGLYKASQALLKSGQLYYGVTIGVQLCSTILASLGLHYSHIVYMSYIPLSSTMACKVFRMLLLCDTTADPLNTVDIDGMLQYEPAEIRVV